MLTRESLFARTEPVDADRAGRMLWLLVTLMLSFTVWANWAMLDEQIRSPGKVIVSSRSQLIQAVDGGVLAQMNVREGQTVSAGDLLAELDQTRFAASAAETRAKALGLRANITRLTAELAGSPLAFSEEVVAQPDLVDAQTDLHARRLEQQREERESIQKSLALAEQELAALERLAATGDAAEAEVLGSRRQVSELRGELANRRNEHRREAQQQLASAQTELDQALQVLKQRQEALQATRIHAPMSGTVKKVGITTIGAVLRPGDEIMQIVPSDDPLLVEARVTSADVAFVRPGLDANVKLDAYDFTVYGSMRGKVTYVSPDTIDVDLEQNEDPYYRVLVEITEMPKPRGGEPIEIIPGMTSLVEIITGHRTVAQYLMKPLRRGSAAALTER